MDVFGRNTSYKKKMKGTKKLVSSLMILLLSSFVFVGCGNDSTANGSTNGVSWSVGQPSPTKKSTEESDVNSTGEAGETNTNNLVGGEDTNMAGEGAANTDEKGGSAGNTANTGNDMLNDTENAVKDVGDAASDAADDVADGVGDAIDNLGGGSFESYKDAKDYLLDKLKKDNASATYEVREETEDLTAYNSNDSGAEGYKFSVYETDGNEKIGIYYVDKDTGKIYRYMGKNSIEAY